jgi:hypothetical protein
LFEEHEYEFLHLPWPAQSPDLNIIEPLWSVLETRVRKRFPPPTFLKQLEDVLQDEWYKIPLETIQNLYQSTPRRNAAVFKAKVGQHPAVKEMYIVSVVFPLFYPNTYIHIHMQYRLGHRIFWLKFIVVCLIPSRQIPGDYLDYATNVFFEILSNSSLILQFDAM